MPSSHLTMARRYLATHTGNTGGRRCGGSELWVVAWFSNQHGEKEKAKAEVVVLLACAIEEWSSMMQ